MFKKTLLASGALFITPFLVRAEEDDFVALQPIEQIDYSSTELFLSTWFQLLVGVTTLLAVVWIVLGGIQYMSTDAYSGKAAGKQKIRNALLGLLLAGASWIILYTINPTILNLGLNFESGLSEQEIQQRWERDARQYVIDTYNATGIQPGSQDWEITVVVSDGQQTRTVTTRTDNESDCRELLRQLQRDSRTDDSPFSITESTSGGFCKNNTILAGSLPDYTGNPPRKDKYTAIAEASAVGGSVVIGRVDIKSILNLGFASDTKLAAIEIYGKDREDCQAQLTSVLDFYRNWGDDQDLGRSVDIETVVGNSC